MRLTRLELLRYGHLADVALDFSAPSGLHVVLGANEAGKSTALEALTDGLFGFPHNTLHDYRYPTRELRVGFALRTDAGQQASFVRRKGRGDTLTDAAGNVVPETVLAALLGGATRDRFQRVFGLDAARLREGGRDILRGEGQVGENILSAQTGLHGFRDRVEQLDAEARALFRGGRPSALLQEIGTYRAAQAARDDSTTRPPAYLKAREEADELDAADRQDRSDERALRAERERLDRIQRTAPAREALRKAEAARADLGARPDLPADAARLRQEARLAQDIAARAVADAQAALERLTAQAKSVVPHPAVLAVAEAIDRLAADRSHVATARRDLPGQRDIAERHRAAIADTTRALGLAGSPEDLAQRVPDALRRNAVTRALKGHAAVAQRLADAQAGLAQAANGHAAAASHAAGHPDPVRTAALRSAVEDSRKHVEIDDAVAQAAETLAEATRARDAALAALPLWQGTAEGLARATLPLRAAAEECAGLLAEAELALREARAGLDARHQALREAEQGLRGFPGEADLPTRDAIAALRARRDAAWAAVRRDPRPEVLDQFEALLRQADALADRREDDRSRVVAYEQARAHVDLARENLAVAAERATSAEAAHAARAGQWRDLWRPAGLEAGTPVGMREWLAQRETVLERDRHALAAQATLDDVRSRRAAAWATLAAFAPPEGHGFAVLLGQAARLAQAAERAHEAERLAADAHEAACAALGQAQGAHEKWQAGWAAAIAGLGLAPEAAPEDGQTALDGWTTIAIAAQAWTTARHRVADMEKAVADFAASAHAIAKTLTLDLPQGDADATVAALAARLAQARRDVAERQRLEAEQVAAREALARQQEAWTEADRKLAVLRRMAGAETDAALLAAVERAALHAELARTIATRADELRKLDGGVPRETLDRDEAGLATTDLPARLEDIDAALRAVEDRKIPRAERRTVLRGMLQAMEHGRDAAHHEQTMRNAETEIGDLAVRYARLRVAHALLSAGIERVRRRQQGPLLARAGALFAALTEGRYERLEAEAAADGTLVLTALRPGGLHCPADRLSEGTRDQLFLALRLAAIETGETLPFVADDLLAGFDDARARAALRTLAEFGATQVILFTHHEHLAALAEPLAPVHRLPAVV
jgi:uncharacterized protein YhaN